MNYMDTGYLFGEELPKANFEIGGFKFSRVNGLGHYREGPYKLFAGNVCVAELYYDLLGRPRRIGDALRESHRICKSFVDRSLTFHFCGWNEALQEVTPLYEITYIVEAQAQTDMEAYKEGYAQGVQAVNFYPRTFEGSDEGMYLCEECFDEPWRNWCWKCLGEKWEERVIEPLEKLANWMFTTEA